MDAPDRSADVRAIAEMHPEAFGPPAETHDERRLKLLRDVVVPYLNTIDQGKWGLLLKTDQGGKIPCDVLVWYDTREHFDVLTGTGANWQPHGPVGNPAWVWLAVQTPTQPPAPAPVPPQPSPVDPDQLAQIAIRLGMIEDHQSAIAANVNWIMSQIENLKKAGYPVYSGSWGITLRAQPPQPPSGPR